MRSQAEAHLAQRSSDRKTSHLPASCRKKADTKPHPTVVCLVGVRQGTAAAVGGTSQKQWHRRGLYERAHSIFLRTSNATHQHAKTGFPGGVEAVDSCSVALSSLGSTGARLSAEGKASAEKNSLPVATKAIPYLLNGHCFPLAVNLCVSLHLSNQ